MRRLPRDAGVAKLLWNPPFGGPPLPPKADGNRVTMQMTIQQFLAGLTVGSALLGFWVALRFPERGPDSMPKAVLHVGMSMALGWAAANALATVVTFGKTAAFGAIFCLLMPTLVYTFLSAAWVMRIATEMLGRYRNN